MKHTASEIVSESWAFNIGPHGHISTGLNLLLADGSKWFHPYSGGRPRMLAPPHNQASQSDSIAESPQTT